MWSVLVEAPHEYRADEEPGEPESALMDALEELGASGAVAGGGALDRISARFSIEAPGVQIGFDKALALFNSAAKHVGIEVGEARHVEIQPQEDLAVDSEGARAEAS